MSYKTHTCLRCHNTWHSFHHYGPKALEGWKPVRCARCRSPRWNQPVKAARKRQSERLQGNERWSGPVKNSRKNNTPAARRARQAKAFPAKPGSVRRS